MNKFEFVKDKIVFCNNKKEAQIVLTCFQNANFEIIYDYDALVNIYQLYLYDFYNGVILYKTNFEESKYLSAEDFIKMYNEQFNTDNVLLKNVYIAIKCKEEHDLICYYLRRLGYEIVSLCYFKNYYFYINDNNVAGLILEEDVLKSNNCTKLNVYDFVKYAYEKLFNLKTKEQIINSKRDKINENFEEKTDSYLETKGQKFDNGKLPIFTVLFKQFPNAMKEVTRCSKSGHNKYPDDKDWLNFKRVDLTENPNRYLDAATRHLIESEGILKEDSEMKQYGGALHLAQAIWNIAAHLERMLENEK